MLIYVYTRYVYIYIIHTRYMYNNSVRRRPVGYLFQDDANYIYVDTSLRKKKSMYFTYLHNNIYNTYIGDCMVVTFNYHHRVLMTDSSRVYRWYICIYTYTADYFNSRRSLYWLEIRLMISEILFFRRIMSLPTITTFFRSLFLSI